MKRMFLLILNISTISLAVDNNANKPLTQPVDLARKKNNQDIKPIGAIVLAGRHYHNYKYYSLLNKYYQTIKDYAHNAALSDYYFHA